MLSWWCHLPNVYVNSWPLSWNPVPRSSYLLDVSTWSYNSISSLASPRQNSRIHVQPLPSPCTASNPPGFSKCIRVYVPYNRFRFPELRILLLKCNPLNVQVSFSPFHVTLWYGAWITSIATTITIGNQLSFISNPGILCLLPAPMKLWKPYLIACNQGKISNPSQF